MSSFIPALPSPPPAAASIESHQHHTTTASTTTPLTCLGLSLPLEAFVRDDADSKLSARAGIYPANRLPSKAFLHERRHFIRANRPSKPVVQGISKKTKY